MLRPEYFARPDQQLSLMPTTYPPTWFGHGKATRSATANNQDQPQEDA